MIANKHQKLFSAPVRSLGRHSASAPSWPRRRAKWLALITALAFAAASPTPALTASEALQPSKPIVIKPTFVGPITPQVFEGDVRDLPTVGPWKPGDPTFESPGPLLIELPKGEAIPLATEPAKADPLLERRESAPQGAHLILSPPGINRDGEPNTGVLPPDTVGDVGPNHYIQMVNDPTGSVFTIYDKGTGAVLAGPTLLTSLAPGAPCDTGIGDPIVLYDRLADRWLMSQMQPAFAGLCLFISTTPDPTGSYFVYSIVIPGGVVHDYPKWGIWPDAYFFSVNDTTTPAPFIGALDRAGALVGSPIGFFFLGLPNTHIPGFEFTAPPIPADLDGATTPPVDAPNTFIRHWDEAAHGSLGGGGAIDFLELWEFNSGFAVTAATVTGPIYVAVADFDSSLCGFTFFNACIPQPGTGQGLHSFKDVVMHRLQYRNFATHETLVGNFTVDVTGTDQAGIRWFELRRTPPTAVVGTWPLFQEGTQAPDATHRWMGSIAMDGAGNIALGYSASSATVFPSILYTGRHASDPLGLMTQGETTIVAGLGSQTSFERWGDYSSMNVDPVDDCTFWYTQEYHGTTASTNWRTRIATLKFSDCAPAGHFLSYRVKRTKGSPKFVKRVVSLADQFETKNFKVKKPVRLLTPVDKDGGGINDPLHHLKAYKIKKTEGQGKHVKLKNVRVDNQFGTIFVDTKKPNLLLVPTLKDLAGPVVLPVPFTPLLDHYKCYRVRRTKGTTKFERLTVNVSDQFITTTLLVKKPKRLCVPVDKDGGGILDPAAHLMCYKVKRVKKRVKGIHVNNQFGPEQLDTKKVEELCVPSTKTP